MFSLVSLVSLPTPQNFLAMVGDWSRPVFDELIPLGVFAIGVIVGGLIVRAIINWIIEAISSIKKDKEEEK